MLVYSDFCTVFCELVGEGIFMFGQATQSAWLLGSGSRGSSWPRDWTWVSTGERFGQITWPLWALVFLFLNKILVKSEIFSECEEVKWSEVAQSCLTLCDPMDCSSTGSSVHRILQARILEWVAISFSRGSSQPRDRTQGCCIAGRCFNLWATREPLLKKKVTSNLIITPVKVELLG